MRLRFSTDFPSLAARPGSGKGDRRWPGPHRYRGSFGVAVGSTGLSLPRVGCTFGVSGFSLGSGFGSGFGFGAGDAGFSSDGEGDGSGASCDGSSVAGGSSLGSSDGASVTSGSLVTRGAGAVSYTHLTLPTKA